MGIWAEAYAHRQVPQFVMGGGQSETSSGSNTDALGVQQLMSLLVADKMGLDLIIKQGATVSFSVKTNQ